jgi:deazaflavin-dependent oxidoreductase (nitroreductase family)
MPERIREVQPPRGLARLAFRAPIWLYNWGLGWMLGSRFLRLTHTGRKSGLQRYTVLEVVRHDSVSGGYIVAVGFGEKSDWYQNVMLNPKVIVESGRKRILASARRLSPEEAEQEMLDYGRRHTVALRELARLMGYNLDGTEQDIRSLGRLIPMLAFVPQEVDQ